MLGEGTEEMEGGFVSAVSEGRGPVVKRSRLVWVEVMADVGREEMQDGRYAAVAEEGGLGLAVADASEEAIGVSGKGGGSVEEKVVGESGAADGMTEEADAGRKLGSGVGVVGLKESEGFEEVGSVGGRKKGQGGRACDGGENLGLAKVEKDAEGGTECLKTVEEPREVDVSEHGLGIVEVGSGGGEGAEAVVARRGGAARSGALLEFSVEGFEDKEENEAGEDGAKRAALCKPFFLEEVGEGAIGATIPAAIGCLVEEVKEVEEGTEFGVRLENMATGVAGDGVKHVLDVEEEESAGRGGGVGEEGFELGEGEMDDEIHAARNVDAALASGGEELDDGCGHDSDAEFGGDSAEGSAHADWA